jgi:signal transduction histidine kinase
VLIQIPYFIRRSEDYVADEFEEIKYEDFQQKLDQNKILFTQIQRVTSQEEVRSWINQHTSEHYEQRFILTLGLRSHQDITDNIKDPSTEHALAQLLGSFLTWAGMAVGDSNHPTMAAAVSRLAHYSHEFLKPFAELRLFLEDNPAAVPTELQNILDKVLNKVELLDLSELADEIQIQRSPGNWPRLREILRLALVNNTTFEKEELAEGSYTPALKIDSPKERKVCIDLKGLPDDSVSVDFDASYFQALIRNLLRNTIQHSSEEQPRIVLSFERQNGFCVMRFKHVGSRISRKIRKQLFRMPMSTRAASADRPFTVSRSGIGLWTVGMAFEAQRLPLPKVTQDDDGVCFSFWFRVANV